MSKRDVISWVIDWMMTNEAAITEELALRCEREARREWGGQRIDYIAKTSALDREQRRTLQGRTSPQKERRIVAAYMANQPMAEIVSENETCRRTIYRAVRRWVNEQASRSDDKAAAVVVKQED